MKKCIALMMILYFVVCKIKGQNLTVVYESYLTGGLQNLPQMASIISEHNVKYFYSLTIDGGISKYSRDSIFVASFPKDGMQEIWTFEDIYKNYSKDLWIKNSGRYREGFGLEEKISKVTAKNNFQWQIYQDSQVIAGIKCIKAVSSDSYTAWFAPKLKYPDGPSPEGFNLPGLVLSFETPDFKTVATKVLMDHNKVQIPSLKLVQDDTEINVSYDDLKSLGTKKVIVLNKDTPRQKWLTFKK
jgi:GLPGLI family protein